MNQHRNPPAKQVGQLVFSASQYYDPNDKRSNPYFGKSGDIFMQFDGQQDSHTTKCWLNPKDDTDMNMYRDWLDWGMKNLSSIKVGIYEPADATRQSQPSQYENQSQYQNQSQQSSHANENKRPWGR